MTTEQRAAIATPGVIPAPLGSDERYDQLCAAIAVAQARIAALLDPSSTENRFARLQAAAHAIYLNWIGEGRYMDINVHKAHMYQLKRGVI